jgi:hypothetical protein
MIAKQVPLRVHPAEQCGVAKLCRSLVRKANASSFAVCSLNMISRHVATERCVAWRPHVDETQHRLGDCLKHCKGVCAMLSHKWWRQLELLRSR